MDCSCAALIASVVLFVGAVVLLSDLFVFSDSIKQNSISILSIFSLSSRTVGDQNRSPESGRTVFEMYAFLMFIQILL